MPKPKPINGVTHIAKGNCHLFHVSKLSNELKDIIRTQLSGVFSGFAHIENVPALANYKTTLKSFFERFQGKTEKTKKGMIGELVSHILFNHFLSDFKSLSILKNKEERSIKKGFDIIYFNTGKNSLWYTEVKSGRKKTTKSNDYNTVLLKRSRTSIIGTFGSNRSSLWENALIDVELMIKGKKNKFVLTDLLSKDMAMVSKSSLKNVILVSVLFHDLTDSVLMNTIEDFYSETKTLKTFNDFMAVSIQKATYEKIVTFLKSEI